jgi:hypothetical protein
VSGHERERLSAYLDGELPPPERAEVAAHLAACPGCAAVLADLAAVDAEAARLPAEAPEGYFERLPSRVVARLESAAKAPGRPWRPPAWAWAAAAALVVALVTPLTLRRDGAPFSTAPPRTVARPPAAPTAVAEGDAGPVREAAPTPLAARPALAPREAMPPPSASPPEAAPGAAPFAAAAPPPSVPEGRAVEEARRQRDALGAREKGEALAAAALDEEDLLADAAVEPEPGPPPLVRSPAAPAAASLESAGRRAEAGGVAAKAAAGDEAERAFRSLDGARPDSVEEWRRQRDAWRAFAAAHPGGRRADEARVRAIEAAREAWLGSGEESDARAFRQDAADYLASPDARQKPRVELLLAAPRR